MNVKKCSNAAGALDRKDGAAQKKAKKPRWMKWGAMAACLVVLGGIAAWRATTHGGSRVIRAYRTNSADCYAAPFPGEVTVTSAVREAREKYAAEPVRFLLGFSIYKEDGGKTVQLSGEERMAEDQRLISLGYKLYEAECWIYQGDGEKRYDTVVVGCFTERELTLFAGNPEYGYLFDFVTNGDGSGISVQETDLIANFPTNAS